MKKFKYSSSDYEPKNNRFYFTFDGNEITIGSSIIVTQGRQNDMVWQPIIQQLVEEIDAIDVSESIYSNTVHESS